MDELSQAVQELRKLSPHPASAFTPDQPSYVVPEASVVPDGDEFKVIPNQESYPRLLISRRYVQMLDDPNVNDETKSYIRQKLSSGKNLIRSLEQRESTIIRIANLIVSKQYEFMKKGPEALLPMTMQEIADKLGLHETTISRAIANKYLQTPVGLFRFRDFFSSGFRSETGDEVSSTGIKEQIREIVSGENTSSPYSDSKIAELLKQKGFDVARRTIAKYREELGIPSSQLRKVY